MKRTSHPAALGVAAAIVGLATGYQLALQITGDYAGPATEELQQTDRQVAAIHGEIDQEEEQLIATRTNSDSLLRSRWTLRTRLLQSRLADTARYERKVSVFPRVLSEREPAGNREAMRQASYLLHRADDQLIARLVLERHQHDRLLDRYQALRLAYRKRHALMQEHVSLSRQAARKKRRRTIILAAAVATAATLLITID